MTNLWPVELSYTELKKMIILVSAKIQYLLYDLEMNEDEIFYLITFKQDLLFKLAAMEGGTGKYANRKNK